MWNKLKSSLSRRRSGSSSASSVPTLRTILLWLVLAGMLPGLIASSVVLYASYFNERDQLERNTIATARALAQTVDADLFKAQAAAQAMATSGQLAANDLSGFYAQASDLLRQSEIGDNFVLSDATGQQLVNTLRPWGSALPQHGNPAQLRRLFDTGKPVMSDIYIGGVLRRPVMSIDVPVLRDGRVIYDLSVGLFPERLVSIPRGEKLPSDWVVSIFDSQGVVAARSHAAERYLGQRGAPALLARMARVDEGMVETDTLEGIPVTAAFSRSPTTRWTVAIGIPRQQFAAQLRQRSLELLLIASVLGALGVLLASALAGRVARSIRALIAPAVALGSGEPVLVPRASLRETEELGAAIRKAADLLALRTLAADVYHTISDGVVATDRDGIVVSVNPAYCAITGYAAEELVGSNLRLLKSDRHDRAFYRNIFDKIELDSRWQGEIWNRRKNGSLFLVRETISAIRDDDGHIEHYVGVISDITEAKQAEESIRHRADHDALTNLPNRARFMERLRHEIARAQRKQAAMALLFIDLDHFKEVNDQLGHDVGDELLKAAAARLQACVRGSDTVARLGGDEFTAILNELQDSDAAARVAAAMLEAMCAVFKVGTHTISISASIGIARYPDDGEGATALLRAADEAMYAAKRQGRASYCFAADARAAESAAGPGRAGR